MQERFLDARSLRTLLADESGTTAIEYALIASLVSIAIAGTVFTVGETINETFYDKLLAAFE